MKRQAKFYKKHEKAVVEKLDLIPVPLSGAGFANKEDGENEFVLAQLKSTDASSFRIKREDLDKLEYNSQVAHKIPLFVTEFLEDGEIYLTLNLRNMDEWVEYWQGKLNSPEAKLEPQNGIQNNSVTRTKVIKSGNREKYNELIQKEKAQIYSKGKLRR